MGAAARNGLHHSFTLEQRKKLIKNAGCTAIRGVCRRRNQIHWREQRMNSTADTDPRIGSQPSAKGPADWFTGTVRIDPLVRSHDPARVGRGERHVRAGCPHRVAHPPARPDADRHRRLRLGAAGGRAGRGDPARRRGVVPAGREALARGRADHRDDAHRHPGKARTARRSTWMEKVTDEQYRSTVQRRPNTNRSRR